MFPREKKKRVDFIVVLDKVVECVILITFLVTWYIQKTGRACELLKLPLPIVNASSLKVVFQDHRTYASSAAVSFSCSISTKFMICLNVSHFNFLSI